MGLRWAEISTLYRWELRSALRDRTIVINSIVLPLVLYPVILWAAFSGIAFVRGQTDDLASRLAVIDPAGDHRDFTRRFGEEGRIEVVYSALAATAVSDRIRRNELDAAVYVEPRPGGPGDDFRVRLVYDGSRERSALARQRVVEIISHYREEKLRAAAVSHGVAPGRWSAFAIERRNIASGQELGSFLLGLLLPLFFVVMVALGCLNPAIDATAGERERGTWETLMSTAASRASIVTAKYLGVATLGGLAGLLNMVAMLLTMRGVVAPLLGSRDDALEFGLSLPAVPILIAGAILLAGVLAAGMMLLAAFARTFREGQSMVAPFYLAVTLPVMFLSSPGLQLTKRSALVPIVNVALAVRDAIQGVIKPWELLIATTATLFTIAVLLRLAALVLSVESVVVGSYSGSFLTFARQRWFGRRPGPA